MDRPLLAKTTENRQAAQPRRETQYRRVESTAVQTEDGSLEAKPFKSLCQIKADQKKLATLDLIKKLYLSEEVRAQV